jgi:hypothetical protein
MGFLLILEGKSQFLLITGAVVAQLVWSCLNLKTLWTKDRQVKSPSGHLILREISMIYALTTTTVSKQKGKNIEVRFRLLLFGEKIN